MISKFQQGGKLEDAIMAFIQQIALVLQTDPNLVLQLAQSNPQAILQAIQVFQQTNDIQQAAQAFQQAFATRAEHGAKLNYIKKLKNQCADDEEVYYYKIGGTVGCGCKKKENGGKVLKNQNGTAIQQFKNRTKKGWLEQNKIDKQSADDYDGGVEKKPMTKEDSTMMKAYDRQRKIDEITKKFKKIHNKIGKH